MPQFTLNKVTALVYTYYLNTEVTRIISHFRYYDPLHEREDEISTKLGYIDLQHLAKRIKAEVVMSTGFLDSICPPSTQFAVYNKISSKKSMAIYPDFGHEDLKGRQSKKYLQFYKNDWRISYGN